jgi:hypothetical protein
MRKIIQRIWIYLFLLNIAIFAYPVSTTKNRLILLFSFFLLIIFVFVLLQGKLRYIYSAIVLALLLFIVLPGRRTNIDKLKESYISSLLKYEGAKYVWGGENRLGIDCSGLVRRALVNANVKNGIFELNPSLIRSGISLWWHDRTAEAIKNEFRNETYKLLNANSINEIDYLKIIKGDLAVTSDGIHVLAYLGNKEWIEADPNFKKVIVVKIPEANNIWFNVPVNVMRWSQLK